VGTFVGISRLKSQQCQLVTFATADGSPMESAAMIPQFTWFMQGHTFKYDARVLPLKCYDVILGADWLEDHNPTWIHWKQKLMKF
jgi:hypothetical protein